MQCPYCSNNTKVLDSRPTQEGIRRRRACIDCKRRFTTYEYVANLDVKVAKRDGKVEPFQVEKLVKAVLRVSKDRPQVTEEIALRLARLIEGELVDDRVKVIQSSDLANRLLSRLRDVDLVAYNRLAANYISDDGQLRTDRTGEAPAAPQLGLFEGDDD